MAYNQLLHFCGSAVIDLECMLLPNKNYVNRYCYRTSICRFWSGTWVKRCLIRRSSWVFRSCPY